MKTFSTTHLIFLLISAIFLVVTMFIVSKLSRKGQNIMFFTGVILCSGGIFFRYAMGLSFEGKINLLTLIKELLQVCSFNFILLPLMLIPKCEVARQYSIFFSMFAASTTLFSVSTVYADMEWHNISFLNSWINHLFAIAVPLWMLAARRLKPRKEYIPKVTVAVFVYFTIVAAISTILIKKGVLTVETSYSFIYDTMGVGVLDFLYKLIPFPYFYLYPLLPLMILFFFGLSLAFKKYEVMPYSINLKI